jgi:hypothetical protein
MKLRKLAVAPMAAAVMALGFLGYQAPAAAADTTYTIDLGNAALTGLGPFATATVPWVDSDDATVTFSSLVSGGYIFLMGASNFVGVNVNAGSWTASAVTESNSLGSFFKTGTEPVTNGGSGNVSTFGIFNQTFHNFDGFKHSATDVSFGLHNTSGTWASSANVLTANADGHTVEIHGFTCAMPGCPAGGVVVTGFATDQLTPITHQIPEPETYAMLLAGLGLMGFVARRRKQNSIA